MARPPRLFVLDTVMVDVTLRVAQLPVRGGDVRASEQLLTTGGGFNVLTAAARHDLDVVYVGQLGTGPMSAVARADLVAAGIATPVAADPTHDLGFCLVLVDAAGERTFVTSTGAELLVTRADLDAVAIDEGDLVFLSGYDFVYPEIGPTVARWLATLPTGVIVAFDPGPRFADIATDLVHAVLARSDWLLCNAVEGLALSGAATLERAPEALLAMTGGEGVVVHDGQRGCLVATRTRAPVRVAAFPATVVDTNGAGDTHDGVFLAEMARGTDPLEAARRANAAAAMAIGRLGPATCPPRAEVVAWFATMDPEGIIVDER